MSKIMTAFTVFFIIFPCESKYYHSFAGKFHLIIKSFEQCPWVSNLSKEDGEPINITIKGHRSSRHEDIAYTGAFYGPFDLDHTIGVRISVASWDTVSGWKENAHIIKMDNICMMLQQIFRSLWISFLISMFGEPLSCPYYAGMYGFQNVTLIKNDSPFKVFFYGKWRADIRVSRKSTNKECGCLRLYADTVPA